MTALPPTKGHVGLVEFATHVGDNYEVILMTQPHEPMVWQRYAALDSAFPDNVWHISRALPQDPESPGFWDLWTDIMVNEVGVTTQDYIVASEPYGQQLADITGATFVPYDPYREITPVKATNVRLDPVNEFDKIAPTFQPYLRQNVTIFGAESTGKTTLAKDLAECGYGHFFMEWARPYLETCGTEITRDSMTAIWRGQAALQRHARQSPVFVDKPFNFFDTDLYSTVGYWNFPHWHDAIGDPPLGLSMDAAELLSDLYIITPSNIPFEEDPIRYGGDVREGSDEYWIQIAEYFSLPYVVLESKSRTARLHEAISLLRPLQDKMRSMIEFDREGF
jgi:NadR type nicotinamide-nucleotide adenylyltransferase